MIILVSNAILGDMTVDTTVSRISTAAQKVDTPAPLPGVLD